MIRHRQELGPMTDINVTNLLDTAFVLLMAFMIVAPAIKHGIELELPTVNGQNIDSEKTATVVIQKPPIEGSGGWIYLDDKRMTLEELTKELSVRKRIFPNLDVMLEADEGVTFGIVAETMGAVKDAGIADVGWLTQPNDDRAQAQRDN
jgi:biopolymer transport protein ExbD